jgi:mannose-6-phosphate isomerase-like protein (cupin superfamily)
MKYYIDIDGTICTGAQNNSNDPLDKYKDVTPIYERIYHVNKLYDEGHTITYWTARGSESGLDFHELTRSQLSSWGCKYHTLLLGKPPYDIYIDDKSHNVDVFWPLTNAEAKVKKATTSIVEKGWGYERIIVNNELYCGKILHFNTGSKFSMHFHMKKRETWYVSSGEFLFKWINTDNADTIEETLRVGDTITNFIGEPHQIICLSEGDIFEVSTQHFDSDSYRVAKGDSQLK